MKEIEKINLIADAVTEMRPVKKEYKRIGSMQPHKGHTLYELDLRTAEVKEATFDSIELDFDGKNGEVKIERKRVHIQSHCLYASALNKKNVLNKFVKMLKKR